MEVKTFFKELPERDEKYKVWIRKQPCEKCRAVGYSVAHHQPKRGESVMGGKVSDRRCIPLCRPHYFNGELVSCHSAFHQVSWPFWGNRDVEKIILRLNKEYETEKLPM